MYKAVLKAMRRDDTGAAIASHRTPTIVICALSLYIYMHVYISNENEMPIIPFPPLYGNNKRVKFLTSR